MTYVYDSRIKKHSSVIVVGPSGSGKTTLIANLISGKGNTLEEPIQRLYVYHKSGGQDCYLDLIDAVPTVIFKHNLPKEEELRKMLNEYKGVETQAVLVDDLQNDHDKEHILSKMFAVFAHHTKTTIFYSSHQLFYKSQSNAMLQRNSRYIFLMRNPLDHFGIKTFARNLNPEAPKFIFDAYTQAVQKPYGNLCIEFGPEVPDQYRVRESVDVTEPLIYYTPESNGPTKENNSKLVDGEGVRRLPISHKSEISRERKKIDGETGTESGIQ